MTQRYFLHYYYYFFFRTFCSKSLIGRYFCCLRDTLSQFVFAYLDFQGIWSYTIARAYTYHKIFSLESQLPLPSHYPWNPLQFSHPLSSLIFSLQNQTERKLILPGHAASQGPLNPLACTAKRCMSLVGI